MKFDLHLHTFFSPDAINNPKNIVKFYSRQGMGFAVTDHNLCDAWPALHKYAGQHGAVFVPGEEIKVFDGKKFIGEFLGLFLQEPVSPGQYQNVLDELKRQDAVVSVAHPFDSFRKPVIVKPMFSEKKLADYILKRVHAVEGFNSRVLLARHNNKAKRFAFDHNLALTGGSDGHFPQELGKGYTIVEGNTAEDLRKAIKKKTSNCAGKLSSPMVHALTVIAKKTDMLVDYEQEQ